MEKTKLTVHIPTKLARRLKLRAAAEGRTATALVVEALEAFVKPVTAAEIKA